MADVITCLTLFLLMFFTVLYVNGSQKKEAEERLAKLRDDNRAYEEYLKHFKPPSPKGSGLSARLEGEARAYEEKAFDDRNIDKADYNIGIAVGLEKARRIVREDQP